MPAVAPAKVPASVDAKPTPPAPVAAAPRLLSGPEIVAVQTRLRRLGFNPGPADGVAGPRTVAAVRAFQAANGLPVTGSLDSRLFDDLAAMPAR
jgi:peptidoglycan hydrolase-like protein with peptidoglycan-binding domain